MSDTKGRELERRWRETANMVDEAALLVELVRSGQIRQGQVELAAFCGHGACLLACDYSVVATAAHHGGWPAVHALFQDPCMTVAGFGTWLGILRDQWGLNAALIGHYASTLLVIGEFEARVNANSPRARLMELATWVNGDYQPSVDDRRRFVGDMGALDATEVGEIARDPLYAGTWGLVYLAASVFARADVESAWKALSNVGLDPFGLHSAATGMIVSRCCDFTYRR